MSDTAVLESPYRDMVENLRDVLMLASTLDTEGLSMEGARDRFVAHVIESLDDLNAYMRMKAVNANAPFLRFISADRYCPKCGRIWKEMALDVSGWDGLFTRTKICSGCNGGASND